MDLVAVFPKLVSLQAEYVDGSLRRLDSNPQLSEGLLSISTTLSTLSLTTTPPWICPDVPPLLLTLNQMTTLKHLTTESIWLFGRQDPSVALQLSQLLPPSLVNFHLIDYWGTCDIETFYPELPNTWTSLEFYDEVFSTLYECLIPNLREITVTPAHLGFCATIAANSYGYNQLADSHVFLIKF